VYSNELVTTAPEYDRNERYCSQSSMCDCLSADNRISESHDRCFFLNNDEHFNVIISSNFFLQNFMMIRDIV